MCRLAPRGLLESLRHPVPGIAHGPAPDHLAQRPDQRAGAARPGVDAGHRALVQARMDGAHAAVLLLGGPAQCRLQAGAGGHRPVPRRLQQPHARDAAAGGAGGDGGDREDLPRGQEPAAHPRGAHPQHLLPGQRAAADGGVHPGRAERAPGLARPVAEAAAEAGAGRRRRAGARAAAAHARPAGAEELRPLHHPAQHRTGAGRAARRCRTCTSSTCCRRCTPAGRCGASRTTCAATKRWRRSSPSCWAWTRG